MATKKTRKAKGAKKSPKSKFEYNGTEFKIFKTHVKIGDKKWRKLKKS